MKSPKRKDIMEYEDAPSGAIKLYNYKEPFMPFEETGIGYLGVLAHDAERDLIQCHYCGQWFRELGNHIFREHGLRATEYKYQTGLSPRSALVSEGIRSQLVAHALKGRSKKAAAQNLKRNIRLSKKRGTWASRTKKKPRGMEFFNRYGSCPAQLLEKIESLGQELGRQPSARDFYKNHSGLMSAVQRTYGSWSKAIEILGYSPRSSAGGLNKGKYKWTREALIEVLINFKEMHKRDPSYSDMRRKLLPSKCHFDRHFGGIKNARKVAFRKEGVAKK